MKRQSKVSLRWSSALAYAIGIITTDGNLSPDGRHINITSKDLEIVQILKKHLRLTNKIGKKSRGGSRRKLYFVLQFGDINFYEFLLSIGLMPAKSKRLTKLRIPRAFFPDFLRGCIDGDGNISVSKHPESQFPQLRVRLASASPAFLIWILSKIKVEFTVKGGYMYHQPEKSVSTLGFGTADSRKILTKIYYRKSLPALKRKRVFAERWASSRIGTGARLRTVWSNP